MIGSVNWLDIVFLILLIGMVYKGSRTGVGGQLLSLAGWLIVIFISINYFDFLSKALFGFLLQKWSRPISFFGLSIIGFTLIKTVERMFNIISAGEELPPIERVGGVIVACIRSVLLFGIISIQLVLIPVDYTRESVMEKSAMGKFFMEVDVTIYSWMTQNLGFVEDREKEGVVKDLMTVS